MAEQAEISFRANVSQLRQQLATLPGLTAGEAQRMVIALERQMQKAEKAAKEAAKATAKASRDASREAEKAAKEAEAAWNGRMGDIKSGAEKVFGGIIGDVGDLAAGFEALPAPAMAAAAAFAAIGGGVAIFAGYAKIAYDIAAGLTSATLAADDYLKKIEDLSKYGDLSELIPAADASQLASLKAANSAVEALGLIAEKVSAQIGIGFAPALEGLALAAVAAGLAISDLVKEVGRAGERFQAWYDALGPSAKALVDLATPIPKMIASFAVLSDKIADGSTVFGDYGKRAAALVGSLTSVHERQAGAADSAKALAEAEKAAAEALRQHNEEVKANASLLALQATANSDLLTAEDRIADAYLASQEAAARAYQSSAMGAQAQALYEQTLGEIELRRLRDTDALRQTTAAAEVDRQKQVRDAEWKRLTETAALQADLHRRRQADLLAEVDLYATTANQIGGLVSDVADLQIAAADKTTKAGRRRAREWFNLQKAASLTEIGINTAVGVTKALAQLGPIAGAIASAGVIASGAAQAAKVAAQKPSFHQGGEVQANLLQGEHVVRQGPAETYRPELNELNRTGELPARSSEMRLRRKDADHFVFEVLEMRGGRTRQALNRGFLLSAQGVGRGLPGTGSGYGGRG